MQNEVAMPEKRKRRALILSLVAAEPIGSQRELGQCLEENGVSVTQATLSRDIRELGLVKAPDDSGGFRYRVSEPGRAGLGLNHGPVVLSLTSSGNLLVIRTRPGFAQSVAAGIDQLHWPQVIGTVGGDDTVIVVLAEQAVAGEVIERLRLFLES
jgi:transcriptional regulator of arginine metabolism